MGFSALYDGPSRARKDFFDERFTSVRLGPRKSGGVPGGLRPGATVNCALTFFAEPAAERHCGGVPRDWHLERYPGKSVAIDMTTDEVLLAADTPEELEAAIKDQGLKNVAAMRAPLPDEPLFVGGH